MENTSDRDKHSNVSANKYHAIDDVQHQRYSVQLSADAIGFISYRKKG